MKQIAIHATRSRRGRVVCGASHNATRVLYIEQCTPLMWSVDERNGLGLAATRSKLLMGSGMPPGTDAAIRYTAQEGGDRVKTLRVSHLAISRAAIVSHAADSRPVRADSKRTALFYAPCLPNSRREHSAEH